MRKNKKLLLASVAAMGALALGVGATSTFAWFAAASASGSVGTVTGGNETMTVTETTAAATNVNVPLLVKVINNLGATDELVLAKYKNLSGTDKNLVSGYLDAAGTYHEVGSGSLATAFPTHAPSKTTWLLYSSLDITVEVDFSKKYTTDTAGWAGGSPDGSGDYDYSHLPAYWKAADNVTQYAIGDILGSLEAKTVDVGIKQQTTTRGRLFEANAANDTYEYTKSDGTKLTANGSGGLNGYYTTATNVALTNIDEAGGATVKSGLFYYVFGDEEDYESGPHTADDENVTATFAATVIAHA